MAIALLPAGAATGAPRTAARVDPVVVDLSAPPIVFTPDQALGAALDGMETGEVDRYLTPFNIARMRSAGLRRVTYRTRPELGIEVWHWTETGAWSDPARQQGYWTGDPNADAPARVTWGYSLPRRGDSIDNANNEGFSRIDDGDSSSFWKSNPYLDRRFTGLAASRPEWIVLSWETPVAIDAARILWTPPFARHFLIQYWDGRDGYAEGKQVQDFPGGWKAFPGGDRRADGGADQTLIRLSPSPVSTHFVRILMLQSSGIGPAGSTDVRDRLGYAVREVALGRVLPDGSLDDVVRHGRTKDTQTTVQVSSTDPWHRAVDRDLGTEQPSLDLVFASGLDGGEPLMVPVGAFYDTPENAAAEIRYIRRRGWPVREVEIGEEPDGQFIRPEDYADLYLETARAVRAVDPSLQLGGPSMEGALTGTWPDTGEGVSWTGRFVGELRARGALDQLQFFSFEHYVFDDVCRPLDAMLREATDELDGSLAKVRASGMPTTIPWVISEYGFSPFAGRAMSEIPSALLAADIIGQFLTEGGGAAYMFGYTPDTPANQNFPCAGYGNMMLYEADDDDRARWPMPVYYAEKMMIEDWGAPADRPHRLLRAAATLRDAKGRSFVLAFPLSSEGGRLALMLVNRDGADAHLARLFASGPAGARRPLFAPGARLQIVQYSGAQYQWLARGEASRPTRDDPPARWQVRAAAPVRLPPMSLTIVSGAREGIVHGHRERPRAPTRP